MVIEIDKSEGILSMTSALQIAGNSKNMTNAILMTPIAGVTGRQAA